MSIQVELKRSLIPRSGVACLAVMLLAVGAGQARATTVFSENMGTPGGTTSIAANTFQNSGTLNYSGTADVRNTSVSSGYVGASGGGNVFFTTTSATNFQIASIDTTAFLAGTLDLSFGAFKSSTASDLSELAFAFSTDGMTYTPIVLPVQPTGAGTAIWRLITLTDTILPSTSNLRLRWSSASASTSFRIDDVTLSGDLIIPEPASFVLVAGGLMIVQLRRRSRAA